jgi:hypothetical protein
MILLRWLICGTMVVALTQPALAQKKTKADRNLSGCWYQDASGASLCFGPMGRLKAGTTNKVYREGLETHGQFRTPDDGVVQLLGFPGSGWPSRSALETCQYDVDAAAGSMTLAECGLAGDWARSCRKVDSTLSCSQPN